MQSEHCSCQTTQPAERLCGPTSEPPWLKPRDGFRPIWKGASHRPSSILCHISPGQILVYSIFNREDGGTRGEKGIQGNSWFCGLGLPFWFVQTELPSRLCEKPTVRSKQKTIINHGLCKCEQHQHVLQGWRQADKGCTCANSRRDDCSTLGEYGLESHSKQLEQTAGKKPLRLVSHRHAAMEQPRQQEVGCGCCTVCCWHQDQLLDTTSRSGFLCRCMHVSQGLAFLLPETMWVLLPQWIFRLHELQLQSHGVGQSRGRLLPNPTLAHVGWAGPRTHPARAHNRAWQASLPCARSQQLRARLHPSIPTTPQPHVLPPTALQSLDR